MKLRIMSPKSHGVADYIMAAVLPLVPRALGFTDQATHVIDAVAGTVAANQMMTRNEVGMIKVLPMQAHLILDAVTGAGLIGCASMLDEATDAERWTIGGIGLHLLLQAAVTRTTPMRSSMSDDAGRGSPMKRYAESRRPEAAVS